MMFQFSNCNLKGQGGLQIHFVKNRFKVLPDKIFSCGHFAEKIRKIYFSVPKFIVRFPYRDLAVEVLLPGNV